MSQWPANLACLVNPRTCRDPVSENKVDDAQAMAFQVVFNQAQERTCKHTYTVLGAMEGLSWYSYHSTSIRMEASVTPALVKENRGHGAEDASLFHTSLTLYIHTFFHSGVFTTSETSAQEACFHPSLLSITSQQGPPWPILQSYCITHAAFYFMVLLPQLPMWWDSFYGYGQMGIDMSPTL